MAVTVASMIDQMRILLNDPSDTQVPFASKMLFLNSGQNAMFPTVFRTLRDVSVALIASTYEYALPASITPGFILAVELETGNATNLYSRLYYYDVIPGPTNAALILTLPYLPSAVGARVRMTVAVRMAKFVAANYAAAGSELYTGLDGTENLPVLYAMSMATATKIDDRQDTYTYNTLQNANATDDQDVMQASSFWMLQFERELASLGSPFPIAKS